ncbi:hypothetical protein D3C87_1928700 [compost metagenome]
MIAEQRGRALGLFALQARLLLAELLDHDGFAHIGHAIDGLALLDHAADERGP